MAVLSKCSPQECGYVAAVALSSVFVNQFFTYKVMRARKTHKVEYPALYAPKDHPDANEFNCIQRAHQNYLEGQPQFLLLLFLASTKCPKVAAAGGALWLASRIAYFVGYSTGDPSKRMWGAFGYPGLLALLGCSCCNVYKMVADKGCCFRN